MECMNYESPDFSEIEVIASILCDMGYPKMSDDIRRNPTGESSKIYIKMIEAILSKKGDKWGAYDRLWSVGLIH